MTRILLAGESWNTYAVHTKGLASYTTSGYEEGADQLIAALRAVGHTVTYLPNHQVVEDFPYEMQELTDNYDVVVLSDVPADSFLLPRAVFIDGQRRPNRLTLITDFIRQGGGMLMIGGFMSFSGFEGRGRYGLTTLAKALPVCVLSGDDRIEAPEGVTPTVTTDHPVLATLPAGWPHFLGYNRVTAKPGATTLLQVDDDPLLTVGTYGKGRVAAFTSDCSPHWGSAAFMEWSAYQIFWSQLAEWLGGAAHTE